MNVPQAVALIFVFDTTRCSSWLQLFFIFIENCFVYIVQQTKALHASGFPMKDSEKLILADSSIL